RNVFFVDVAPDPALPGLGRGHDWVSGLAEVRGGVPMRRGITTADMPAGETGAQRHPAAAELETLLAPRDGALDLREAHLAHVRAGRIDVHGFAFAHRYTTWSGASAHCVYSPISICNVGWPMENRRSRCSAAR